MIYDFCRHRMYSGVSDHRGMDFSLLPFRRENGPGGKSAMVGSYFAAAPFFTALFRRVWDLDTLVLPFGFVQRRLDGLCRAERTEECKRKKEKGFRTISAEGEGVGIL